MNIKVNPNWWKTMFNEVYLITDARSVCDEDITRREVDAICELLPIRQEDRILDLCGGQGRHCFALFDRGFVKCTLLDYSQYLIDTAKARAADNNYPIEFICSDARNTGLSSGIFDHVLIMGNSIGYIQEHDADGQIMAEAYRLLRPGGWFLVDVSNGAVLKNNFSSNAWHEIGDEIVVCRQRELHGDIIYAREMVLNKKKGMIRDETYAIRLYDSQILVALFEQTGFKQISVHTDFSPHRSKGDYGFMNNRMIVIGQKI